MTDKNFIKYIIIGFTAVLVITTIGLCVFLFTQIRREGEEINYLQQEIEKISKERIAIAKKVKDIREKKEAVNDELKKYNEDIELLTQELSSVKKVRDEIVSRISEKERIVLNLENKLNFFIKQESEMTAQLKNNKLTYQQALESIKAARGEKEELEEKVKAYLSESEGVELKRIVVRAGASIEGKIVEVNNDYNFSIIDIGSEDNIKSGEILGIYRENKLIAKAIVENVYDDMSSITALGEFSDIKLFVGDTVKILL